MTAAQWRHAIYRSSSRSSTGRTRTPSGEWKPLSHAGWQYKTSRRPRRRGRAPKPECQSLFSRVLCCESVAEMGSITLPRRKKCISETLTVF
jgi:hypothetical protein